MGQGTASPAEGGGFLTALSGCLMLPLLPSCLSKGEQPHVLLPTLPWQGSGCWGWGHMSDAGLW